MRWAILAATLVACAPPQTPNCAGLQRRAYVVDAITLPEQRADFAFDLNGDERPDDQLGNIAGAFTAQNIDMQAGMSRALADHTLGMQVGLLSDGVPGSS